MLGPLLANLKSTLKWAAPLDVKDELDTQMLELLGPKDDRDNLKLVKKKEKELSAVKDSLANVQLTNEQKSVVEIAKSNVFITQGEMARMHRPGENPQIRPDIMKAHLKRTNKMVITRFPPEPNGFLHIGHAKAININFGFAACHGGITNLRYDDTNPEAEEEMYFKAIKDTVEWLGYIPTKVTYSSDHFMKLYQLAVQLINSGHAYVCHSTGHDIHLQRGGDQKGPRTNSPWRDRPIAESLAEFEKMRQGVYQEGDAILRLKMDMQHPNPQFWDLVAYRILRTKHIRTGDEWVIYPTYDFTHPI